MERHGECIAPDGEEVAAVEAKTHHRNMDLVSESAERRRAGCLGAAHDDCAIFLVLE